MRRQNILTVVTFVTKFYSYTHQEAILNSFTKKGENINFMITYNSLYTILSVCD